MLDKFDDDWSIRSKNISLLVKAPHEIGSILLYLLYIFRKPKNLHNIGYSGHNNTNNWSVDL